jgi:hypothetical protein
MLSAGARDHGLSRHGGRSALRGGIIARLVARLQPNPRLPPVGPVR